MKRVIVALSLCAVVAAIWGCAPSETVMSKDQNGDSVDLKVGQVLVVELPGNPTTGYTWQAVDLPAVLKQQGETEFKADSNLVGAGGMLTLRFEAAEAGTGTLDLEYARSWEDTAALETYSLEVTVRD